MKTAELVANKITVNGKRLSHIQLHQLLSILSTIGQLPQPVKVRGPKGRPSLDWDIEDSFTVSINK
jgi:hypothetical protein